jgi:hypothetical protein
MVVVVCQVNDNQENEGRRGEMLCVFLCESSEHMHHHFCKGYKRITTPNQHKNRNKQFFNIDRPTDEKATQNQRTKITSRSTDVDMK